MPALHDWGRHPLPKGVLLKCKWVQCPKSGPEDTQKEKGRPAGNSAIRSHASAPARSRPAPAELRSGAWCARGLRQSRRESGSANNRLMEPSNLAVHLWKRPGLKLLRHRDVFQPYHPNQARNPFLSCRDFQRRSRWRNSLFRVIILFTYRDYRDSEGCGIYFRPTV